MMNNRYRNIILASFLGLAVSTTAQAQPFSAVSIGDRDGFGFDADQNFDQLTGDGGHIDRNNDNHLGAGDVLPSLNGGGGVATGSGDDFDNRLNEGVSCNGCTDNGSVGVEYTDISLSTSYDSSRANGQVYNANTSTRGNGGRFPSPPSSTLSNQPGFTFDFSVGQNDILAGTDIFFNLVFGDYDVIPADIDLTYSSAPSETVGLTVQDNGPDDGLIQGTFVQLDFDDVFTWDADGLVWNGFLTVDFDAVNEPYTAFDYVELSVVPFTASVPEPGSVVLLSLGLMGLGFARKKSRQA